MSRLNFFDIEPENIYDTVMEKLEEGVGEQLYPGDERRIFGEAVSAVLIQFVSYCNDRMQQRFGIGMRGEVLDAFAKMRGVARLTPEKASVTVRFSVSEPLDHNLQIPAGTKTSTGSQMYFATDAAAVILAGEMYADVPSSSEAGGSAYNGVAPGGIINLVDVIPDISEVANTDISAGGSDGEPNNEKGDGHLFARALLVPSSYSTAGPEGAYKFFAMSAHPDIVDSAVISPSPGRIKIVPLMRDSEMPSQDILDAVLLRCNDKTVRPMGDLVTAAAPETAAFDISIKYYCPAANESAVGSSVEGAGGAVDGYIEWQQAALGRDINPDELRKRVLMAGASRVEITSPAYSAVAADSVAHFSGMRAVTHEVTG